jgi:hypothetical protein
VGPNAAQDRRIYSAFGAHEIRFQAAVNGSFFKVADVTMFPL